MNTDVSHAMPCLFSIMASDVESDSMNLGLQQISHWYDFRSPRWLSGWMGIAGK